MIELDVKSFVQLALGDELKGGSIQVTRDADRKGLFAHRLPLTARKVDTIGQEIVAAIDLDWRSSGKKEARTYTLSIINAARDIESQRVFACEPEPVSPSDIVSQSAAVTLVTLNDAAATIRQPFEQLKELLTQQRTEIVAPQKELLDHYKGELEILRARNASLEKEIAAKTDELREHKGKYAEAERLGAEAEKARAEGAAALVVAQAQARSMDRFTSVGVEALPKLAVLAGKVLGGKKLGGMLGAALDDKPADKPAGNAARTPRKVDIVREKATAFPPALAAKVRGLQLNDLEIARLLMFLWLLDPEGDALELLTDETGQAVFALLGEVHAHLSGKTSQ